MTYSQIRLNRLRITRRGEAVYDQKFHAGVNIIRGENGSGKSTIADFIFYILGGEFENWKTAAAACDQIQAEVTTRGGIMTLRRDIERAQTPIDVYFGPMSDAEKHGLDGWESYPIRRSGGRESFSQIMFRASGIPEAQSQGAANITMNQIMRLLYSDQRTPAAFLFRYESFDTREIRGAVGDLICGLSVYELYENELTIRELDKRFDEKSRRLSAMLDAMPSEEALANVETIDKRLVGLSEEDDKLRNEITNAADHIDENEVKSFVQARTKAAAALRKYRDQIAANEQTLQVNDLETTDLTGFLEYLEELSSKLAKAEGASEIVGNIDFTHCPACLTPLTDHHDSDRCILCGADTDREQEKSRYLQIRMDIDIQLRESRQLFEEKTRTTAQLGQELRRMRRDYQNLLSEYTVRYDVSTSPRESFIAERFQRIGQIDRERTTLGGLRERALEIQALSEEKATLQEQINRLKDRQKALEASSRQRRMQAMTRVSDTARGILTQDLERQAEFKNANDVIINFEQNSVHVDGELNFAESSNVIVKNTAILSLLLAATEDENIEDKGMEQERSHNFQEIIVRTSKAARLDHQVIFTTSMFNPALDEEELVIGPHYNHENRALNLPGFNNE